MKSKVLYLVMAITMLVLSLPAAMPVAAAGTLSFAAPQILPTEQPAGDAVVGDFNKDGTLDIATDYNTGAFPNNPSRFALFLGTGGGNFGAPTIFDPGAGPWTGGDSLEAGDFNKDGNLDLAMIHGGSNSLGFGNIVTIHLGNGAGGFAPRILFTTGGSPGNLRVGDINEDGNPDLVISGHDAQSIFTHMGAGNGNFNAGPVTAGGAPDSIVMGDFNGDGHQDLAGSFSPLNTVKVLFGNGTGAFSVNSTFTITQPTAITSGDFNEDGIKDLALNTATEGKVYIILGTGGGTFAAPVGYPAIAPSSPGAGLRNIQVGDFNQDGHQDLVMGHGPIEGTNISIWFGDGHGGPVGAPVKFTSSTGAAGMIAPADLNADGRMDMAVSSENPPGVSVLLNTTTAAALQSIAVTPTSATISAGTTQQFTAIGTYSDNSTANLTATANWTSSNPTAAIITVGGLATGIAAGTTNITASVGGITSNVATLIVTGGAASLVAKYTFNDGTATDSSGHGNNGTIYGATVVDSPIAGGGQALSFNNNYVSVPNTDSLNPSYISVEAWVYPTSYGYYRSIVNKEYNSSHIPPWSVYILKFREDTAKPSFWVTVNGVNYDAISSDVVPMNVWTHWVGTYDGETLKIYVNGVLAGSDTTPSGPLDNRPDAPVYIGATPGTNQHYYGKLDEVAIYNGALTAEAIAQHYLNGLKTLASIVVTPAATTISTGITQQFTAIATYTDNTTANITAKVNWVSSNPAVATIASGGLATGLTAGTTNITASLGGINSNIATLTVSPAAAGDAWTFMVYIGGDNNLSDAGIGDLNEMEVAGSTDNVNIIVLMDLYGDNNTRVYQVQKESPPTNTIISPTISVPFITTGELDTGNPASLVSFAEWTIDTYPASHYALVLWNHGSGWRGEDLASLLPPKGIAFDDTSMHYINTPQLGNALNQIKTDKGVTFDIIGMDACYMQMAEVAYQIRDYGRLMVSSEEVVPGDGLPYDTILADLTANPASTPEDVSNNIVNKYMASYPGLNNVTLSTINLAQMNALATAADQFAAALISDNQSSDILNVVWKTEAFSSTDYRDLYHFATLVSGLYPVGSNVRNKAVAVLSAINNTVSDEAHGSAHPNAHGISIFLTPTRYDSNYNTLAFAANTQWDEFLRWLLETPKTQPFWHEIIADSTGEGTPDIQGVDAFISTKEDYAAFRVRATSTLNFANLVSYTLLDTDSNNATGYNGSLPWLPQNDIGADFLVQVATPSGAGREGLYEPERLVRQALYSDLFHWEPAGPSGPGFYWVSELPCFTDTSYFWFTATLSLIDTDGNNKMNVVELLGTLTAMTDKAPNIGHGKAQATEPPWRTLTDDPSGDQTVPGTGPDITKVQVSQWPDKILFKIAGNNFDYANIKANTLLDVDSSNTTGMLVHTIGADYNALVTGNVTSALAGNLKQWNPSTAKFDIQIAPINVYDEAGYFWFAVPLSLLGPDDGEVNVVAEIGTPGTFPAAKTDTAPNTGYVHVGQPTWTEIITDPVEGVNPDIIGVDKSLPTDAVAFRVRTNQAINFNDFVGHTVLDIDQNPATGGAIWNMGVEYMISAYGDGTKVEAILQRCISPVITSSAKDFEPVRSLPIFTSNASYWTWVPLSLLDNDDGAMTVAQVVGIYSTKVSTDVAPNPPAAAPAAISWSTLITDPAGDGTPDITLVERFRASNRVGFRVNGAFSYDNLTANTYLDIDQNAATGSPINDIGADYAVKVQTGVGSVGGALASWNGTDWQITSTVTVNTTDTDRFWFEIMLTQLGNDQGNMDVVQTISPATGVVTDTAPNTGHKTIGEPRWAELLADPIEGVNPDIVGVDIALRYTRTGINFRVRANGIDFANLIGKTFIDIDQDATSGYTGADVNDMGADYVVTVNSTGLEMPKLQGQLDRHSTTSVWEKVAGVSVLNDGYYYWFGLNYSDLGNDDGIMDVVQLLGTITPAVLTDKAPNTGHAVIAPRANVEEAIADGIEWLVSEQNLDGSWGTGYPLAKTALAVLKLETHATSANMSPFDTGYAYHTQVEKGLNYIFQNAYTANISTQTAGNPDTDADGKGVYFYIPPTTGNAYQVYHTSLVMMAIAASNAPSRVVSVNGSAVNGWTYQQVLQDAVDYLAYAQTDSGYGRGGWNYGPMNNAGSRSDQSNSGWASLALAYAESPSPIGFSLTIPGFVRSELDLWIDYIQDDVNGDADDGGAWYTGPSDTGGTNIGSNMLRTGNLLQQMAFVGDTLGTSRVQDAIDYLVRHWSDNNTDPGWRGYPANYHAMYTIMKGLEAYKLENIISGSANISWFPEFVDALIFDQNPYGSWSVSSFDDGEQILSTEWAMLTLQKTTAPTREAPDLVITEKHEQCVEKPIGTYKVYFTVENKGNVEAAAYQVGLFVDNISTENKTMSALAAGASENASFSTVVTVGGDKDAIRVTADVGNAIPELIEDNNDRINIWPPKPWTFMVYMAADSELDNISWQSLNEMEMAGSTDNVNIVVLRDGKDNGDSRIYYVQHDTDMSTINSPVVSNLGEVNMGNNLTLVNFVKWTAANYPGDQYALVLWDKVADNWAAWKGVCVDSNSGNDYLTTPEIGQALAQTGIVPALLGFDTGLQALTEVAYEVYMALPQEYIIVASEERQLEHGWVYAPSLTALSNNPLMTATALASQIISDYVNYSNSQGWTWSTLSAVNSAQASNTGYAVSSLALQILISSEPDIKTKVKTARDTSERFWFNSISVSYVDLYDFAQRVRDTVSDNAVKSRAQDVMNAVNQEIMAEGHGSSHPNAYGVSIYYPTSLERYNTLYSGTYLAFTNYTHWDEFLTWIIESDTTPPPTPTLVSPSDGFMGGPAPVLKWNGVSDISGVTYSLQVSDNNTFATLTENITNFRMASGSLFYRITPPLKPATTPATYYWRIQAVDGAGNSSNWTEAWSFRVTMIPKWSYTFQPAINRMIFGQSVAIADLGVNTKTTEPNSDLEIATGSDECGVFNPELNAWVKGIWRVFDSNGDVEWAKDTQSDQSRSSAAIADLNGDGNLEIIGGTTSGETVEVMDKNGNFVWTFPNPPRAGNTMWHSSPAVADVNTSMSGLEVIIGNRPLHSIFAFDGDNSEGVNDGIIASSIDWSTIGEGTKPWAGTEGVDWDLLWIFTAAGRIASTPAIGDVDGDGQLEVVFGAGIKDQGPADGKIYVLNASNGSLKWSYQTTAQDIVSSVGLANFDGDAALEIVVGASDGKVYFINNNGDGVIDTSEVAIFTTTGAFTSSPSIGDVDGDGNLEVIIGSTNNNVYSLAYNTASNTVTEKWNYPTGGDVYSSAALVKRITGDLNLYTELLIARPGFNSIEELLAKPGGAIIGINTSDNLNPYRVALQTALNSYGTGSYTLSTVSTPDIYAALEKGIVDAALTFIRRNPWSTTQQAISQLGCKLLPWSSTAINAVTTQLPRAQATQLPANTYTGQTMAVAGYVLRHWLDIYIGSEDGNLRVLDGVSGRTMASWNVGAPIRSSPAVADIDGDGRLEVVFADWSPIVESIIYRDTQETQTRTVMSSAYTGSGDILWAIRDGNSSVSSYANEWSMFRGDLKRDGFKSSAATPSPVTVSISTPAKVPENYNFLAKVDISQVTDFNAASFDISFNPAVLRCDNITNGQIGATVVPVTAWNEYEPGKVAVVVHLPGVSGVSGAGYLASLHFHVLGATGSSSNLTFSNGALSNSLAQHIPAEWTGALIEVSVIPGDANMDGLVDAVDVTKVERIIVRLDAPTPGADANQDSFIDAVDVTKVERIIVHLN